MIIMEHGYYVLGQVLRVNVKGEYSIVVILKGEYTEILTVKTSSSLSEVIEESKGKDVLFHITTPRLIEGKNGKFLSRPYILGVSVQE